MKRLSHLLVAWLLASALALPAAAEPLRIAALYNLTGGMSSIDTPGLNGARLAAKRINESGGVLGGRMIEVVGIDTETDQRVAAAAAKKALSEGVVAGVGYGDTTFVMAAAPLFMERKVPFVTSGATHPELPAWLGEYFFMVPFGDDDQSFAIAEYAMDALGARKVAIWTDEAMDFTTALSRYFKERILARGGEVVLEDHFMAGDTDFSAQVARLRNACPRPDAVFVSAIPNEAGLAVKQIRQAGLALPIVSGDGFDTELVATVPGPGLARDVFFSTHTYRGDTRPMVRDFIRDYHAAYGRDPENAFAALGYDAVALIANAIERAGSADSAPLREALDATRDFEGVTGKIAYTRANGVPLKPVAIIGVRGGAYTVERVWLPTR
ncbi:ABC transporter substrate-binding protein [Desulfolutivibrio sulfoxidireducens]|uniref:ABC transporter substrate-binding protein n=1 Tax=Desulfolutivibrio sulfoxidireducens TaxID=2773299 RepID=UPI00159D34F7|nr:ABC transporter substrate-binding protein [Desulfolutivibrio sulfoxidireducens]QLA18366.1 ABC transporter substrate-binding protein [Desulfolutivibrio sulfoxidireducens]